MRSQESIEIDRLPRQTPGSLAYHYLVGYAAAGTREWWSDFHVKEMALEKSVQEVLDAGLKFLPELDNKRKWRVCIVDIKQENQVFSEK